MSNLLRCDLLRVIKGRLHFVFPIAAAFSVFIVCINYIPSGADYLTFESVFFITTPLMPFLAAAFISLFVGQDYSDGTIRNKLIIGHSRVSLYFTNLISVTTVMAIIYFIHTVVTYIGAHLVYKYPISDSIMFAKIASINFLAILSICALFVAVSINFSNKTLCVIIMFAFVMGITIMHSYVRSALFEPEMISDYVVTADGITQSPEYPNPLYIAPGLKRQIFEFIQTLPMAQLADSSNGEFTPKVTHVLMNTVILALSSFGGCVLFRKKILNEVNFLDITDFLRSTAYSLRISTCKAASHPQKYPQYR